MRGDNSACAALLKRHEPELAKQMWRFTRNRAVQEELVEEVLVEAYLSLRRYRPGDVPFIHWLRCIATRVGYRYWKLEARKRKHQPIESIDPPAADQEFAPDDAAAAAATLHNLLARLPAPDRLVLTLMYFEECSLRDIADRTGWNSAVVKMRAYRARGRLKSMIEKEQLVESLMGAVHGPA